MYAILELLNDGDTKFITIVQVDDPKEADVIFDTFVNSHLEGEFVLLKEIKNVKVRQLSCSQSELIGDR